MDKITRQVRIEHWTQIMNECLNSGMNKTEWCRANGISDKQFFYWQRILRKEAFAASTSKDLSVITDPADETSPQKISFAEISIPIKQESVRNGFHPDIILRKGPVSVEISNSVSAELLSRIGDIFHAERCFRVPQDLSRYRLHRSETWYGGACIHYQVQFSAGSVSKRYSVPVLRKTY